MTNRHHRIIIFLCICGLMLITHVSLSSQTLVISGTVKDGAGKPIVGVVMSGLPGDPTTDNDGNYGAYLSPGWSGTVTPSKSGWVFTPRYRTYHPLTTSHQHDNYTGSGNLVITGTVRDRSGNPIVGVVMNGFPLYTTTDNSGNYGAYLQPGWSGTITPTKSGWVFTRQSLSYSNISLNYINQDYTGEGNLVITGDLPPIYVPT